MISPIEKESRRHALDIYNFERMTSAADVSEIHTWMLARQSAIRELKPATWFTVDCAAPVAVVRIGNDIGTDGATAETLLTWLEGFASIELIIDSRGGDSNTALKLYNGLQGRVDICTVNNFCASAAVIVAMAAKKIRIEAGAKFMLHAPKSFVFQAAPGLREAANRLADISAKIKSILKDRTGRPDSVLDSWLDSGKDFYFTAQEGIDAGLADEIFTAPPVSPLDPAHYDNPTDEAEFFRLLKTFPAVHVRDRAKFLRGVSAWLVHHVRE
jgi:ATP-dependent protease ClpP protease subunit